MGATEDGDRVPGPVTMRSLDATLPALIVLPAVGTSLMSTQCTLSRCWTIAWTPAFGTALPVADACAVQPFATGAIVIELTVPRVDSQ